MRRPGDRTIYSSVSADEYALLCRMVEENRCSSIANLVRMGINSLAMEAGDEAVFIDSRERGRPRKARSA